MLKLALEGAGFISAYDRNGIRRSLGVVAARGPRREGRPRARRPAGRRRRARRAAARDGSGYSVTLKADRERHRQRDRRRVRRCASGRDGVLGVATDLGNRIRTALGDDTSDSAQRFATEKLSATSLDVVREYALAMQALSSSQFDEARQASNAPSSSTRTSAWPMPAWPPPRPTWASPRKPRGTCKEAIRHVDRMTERERFRTRGLLYYLTNDYEACVKEYGDLLASTRPTPRRATTWRCARRSCATWRARARRCARVVTILPKRSLYRVNASLYSAYAGDFAAGEQDARWPRSCSDRWALQALALAQLGQQDSAPPLAAYESLGKSGRAPGRRYTASGLADIALYQGRFADAVRLFTEGAAADLADKEADRAADKLAALAYTELAPRPAAQARAAADQALANSTGMQVRFLAARIYAEAGAFAAGAGHRHRARRRAAGRAAGLRQAHRGRDRARPQVPRAPRSLLTEANELLDTWIGRFDLGRAYLAAGAFPQADSEFDRCLKRSGEALSLFLDEEPTSGYLPPVYYYQGRVREAPEEPARRRILPAPTWPSAGNLPTIRWCRSFARALERTEARRAGTPVTTLPQVTLTSSRPSIQHLRL